MELQTIKDVCDYYGMKPLELANAFDIPKRTVEDWYAHRRTPPAYVVTMIARLLEQEAKNDA